MTLTRATQRANLPPIRLPEDPVKKFVLEFSSILTDLICSGECECSEMQATDEWHYLCAAHSKPKDCRALDYMRHTIDGSIALLLSQPSFGKRKEDSGPILRRLYRIYAHLYFHHREFFDKYEVECDRFVVFLKSGELVGADCFIIPGM